jgi:hypothetical protein
LSPDGKWLAYVSNVSGAYEVYVRPYPRLEPTVLVSLARWYGTNLVARRVPSCFFAPARASCQQREIPSPARYSAPRGLFSGSFDFSQERNWALSPDGSFIMIKADPTMGRQLRVVFNWFDELADRSTPK